MKRAVKIILSGILFLAVIGLAYTTFMGPGNANACNWGSQGGKDYVSQKRGSTGPLANRSTLTKEQAYDIVANHIKKLNPNLEVGDIKDAGRFYEAEVLSEGKEVIERLAVDKQSGRLMPIY